MLNLYGSRSFEDLSQYPIMPWVVSSYKTSNLDFPKRNLSKVVGCFQQDKTDMFKAKYFEMVNK